MPRPPSIHPEALLLTYRQAGAMLGATREEVEALVRAGYIKTHATLPGKVTRASVIDLALESHGAQSDEAGGWQVQWVCVPRFKPDNSGVPFRTWGSDRHPSRTTFLAGQVVQ